MRRKIYRRRRRLRRGKLRRSMVRRDDSRWGRRQFHHRRKKRSARRPPLKRPAPHTAALPAKRQKRPATATPTEAHPNLCVPGAGKQTNLCTTSRVYTDVKNSRWRLFRRAGDTIEKIFYWKGYSSPEKCWGVMVAELRSLNP